MPQFEPQGQVLVNRVIVSRGDRVEQQLAAQKAQAIWVGGTFDPGAEGIAAILLSPIVDRAADPTSLSCRPRLRSIESKLDRKSVV